MLKGLGMDLKLLKRFLYLIESHGNRKWERGGTKQRDILSTGSLFKWPCQPGVNQAEVRSQEVHPDFQHGQWEPKHLSHLPLPRRRIRSGAATTCTSTRTWGVRMVSGSLIQHPQHCPAPASKNLCTKVNLYFLFTFFFDTIEYTSIDHYFQCALCFSCILVQGYCCLFYRRWRDSGVRWFHYTI